MSQVETGVVAQGGGASVGGALRVLRIDARLLGMIGALLIIWVGFDLLTGGLFLTPRNLFNLSVQTASVAVMATGMVFIIVMRHTACLQASQADAFNDRLRQLLDDFDAAAVAGKAGDDTHSYALAVAFYPQFDYGEAPNE